MDISLLFNSGVWRFVLALGGAVLGLFLLLGLGLYLLQAWGLYRLAKNQGLSNGWVAFIPVVQLYILGKIIGDFRVGNLLIKRSELVLPLGMIVAGLLGNLPLVGGLVYLAVLFLFVVAVYHLFLKYKPDSAVLFTLLSFILPFMLPILTFYIRNFTPDGAE